MRRGRTLAVVGLAAAMSAAAWAGGGGDPLAGHDFVPGEVLVNFDDHLANSTCLARSQAFGLTDAAMRSHESDVENLVVARVSPGEDPRQVAARLQGQEGVESASPNWVLRALYEPNDPRFGEQWHMRQIHAPEAWDVTRGRGVVVAVIDTGVTFEKDDSNPKVQLLEDLEGTGWVKGYDFVNSRVCAVDDHAHGNHVAGTIAQSTNNGKGVAGVAYEAKIMPIKVLSRYGSGTMQQVHDGIKYAADHGADVINMSLGGGPSNPDMRQVVQYARKNGVIVVCAAGNDGSPFVSYPAAYEGAVAISSVNSLAKRAFYSNWGDEIALAAPGGDREDHNGDGHDDGVLQQTIHPGNPDMPDYLSFIGTSMASPHAAGVAALVKSLGVTDPDACLKVMQDSATPLENPEGENYYGAGLVDARAAVDRVAFWFSLQKFALAILILILVKRLVPVRTGASWCPAHFLGLHVGSVGLFFLPYLGVHGFPLQDLICKGFPEWDLFLFGAGGHGNPLFYSALVPMALLVLLFRAPRPVRAFVAGFSIGVAGHLLWYAIFPVAPLHYIPDLVARFGDQAFLAVNAGLAAMAGAAMRLGEEQP